MALHHQKRRTLGMPEVLMAVGFLASTVFGTLWFFAASEDTWQRAVGTTTEAKVESVHYNATEYAARVHLAYRYSVNGVTFAAEWSGLWPSIDSPDALSSDRIAEIEQADQMLTVFYDPDNPANSTLHAAPESDALFANLAIACFIVTFFYAAIVYPRWKNMRANAPRIVAAVE